MREVPVTVAGAVDEARAASLAAALRRLHSLGDVLAWGRAQSPPLAVREIVTQDEYTHDVVIAIEPRLALVFDVT